MAYDTNMLIALAFIVIAIVFLIMYFVKQSKVIKLLQQTTEGSCKDSKVSAKQIIDGTKKLLWYMGISYVTIALAILFEGISGALGSVALNTLFVVFSVVFFVIGVIFTAYGVLALYNENEQKYGHMEKAELVSICNLADGKKLLVFVPNKSMGIEVLTDVEKITRANLAKFKQAGGTALDFCVVDDASNYRIGTQYLLYAILLRIRYAGVKTTFISKNAIEASVVAEKIENTETKETPAQEQQEKPVAEKKQTVKKIDTEKAKPRAKKSSVKKS